MKRCTHCKEEKEDEAFYKQNNTRDGLGSWCKSCMKTMRRKDEARGRNGETYEPSTILVMDLLENQGIPCTVGRGIGKRFVDIAAWGCVPIEAKTSQFGGGVEGFSWKFSIKQQERWFDGLIAFVAVYPSHNRLFLVPADIPEIRYRPNGRQRTNLYVDFGTSANRRGNYDPRIAILLRKYENAFELIEEYRVRASQALKKIR